MIEDSRYFFFNNATLLLSAVLLIYLGLAAYEGKTASPSRQKFHLSISLIFSHVVVMELINNYNVMLGQVMMLDGAVLLRMMRLFSSAFASFSVVSFCLYLSEEKEGIGDRAIIALEILLMLESFILEFYSYGSPICYSAIFAFQILLVYVYVMINMESGRKTPWLITGLAFPIFMCVLEIIFRGIALKGFGYVLMLQIVYMNYQVQLEKELLARDKELSDARVSLLMQQISPHFIFNSLQVIQGLCDEEPDKVKPAISHFSAYLRGNLESLTTTELIPFEKELDHAREYIKLEQISDGNEFSVDYDLEVMDFFMPSLILQPVVENAVRYGVGSHDEGSRIGISTRKKGREVIIKVTDDGKGSNHLTDRQKNRQSVGLKNIKERLSSQCGGSIYIDKKEDGTTVTIVVPQK